MLDGNGQPVSEIEAELLRNVGSLLKSFRETADLTQRGAAEAVGSTQATVSYLENGKVDFHILTLQRWAEFYGCNVEIHFVPVEDEFDRLLREAVEELAP